MRTRTRMTPALYSVLRFIEGGETGAAPTTPADQAPPPTPADSVTGATTPPPANTGDDEPLGEPGKRALEAERTAKKDAEQRARAANDALTTAEQAKTAAEQRVTALEAELTTYKDRAATAQAQEKELWLYKALADHPVAPDHRHLVKGDTEAELQAAAESISQLTSRPGVVPLSGKQSEAPAGGSIADYKRRITNRH